MPVENTTVRFYVLTESDDLAPAAEEKAYCSAMTRTTIEVSQLDDQRARASKLLTIMDMQINQIGSMARSGQTAHAAQFALAYCRVAEDGVQRFLAGKNGQWTSIRKLFSEAGKRHEKQLLDIMESLPGERESIRKAIDACRMFRTQA